MPKRQQGSQLPLKKISLIVASVGILLLIGLLAGELIRRNSQDEATARGLTAAIGGPFSLVDQTGQRRSEADFAGQPMLIFFGFTYCPDVCPTALDRLGVSLDILRDTAPQAYAKLQPLFISVDPARDTPDALAEYLAYFHPKITGLTGTTQEIDAVKRAYKVYAARAQQADENGNYLVDHSSFFYLMDGDNKYLAHFPHMLAPEEMAQQLSKKLSAE